MNTTNSSSKINPEEANAYFVALTQMADDEGEIVKAMKIGELFSTVRRKNLWKPYAETWYQYLSMPEIKKIGKSFASVWRKVTVYEKFIKEYHLDPKDLKGLDLDDLSWVAKRVTPDTIEEWLHKVRFLPAGDLRAGEVDQVSCEHKNIKEIPAKRRCSDCGAIIF
jgi:hypothetical protein